MIDERIVALAKEFHELGGCNVKVLSKGRWYIDSNNRTLELWTQEEMDIPEWMRKRNIEKTTIPILDESKLWAWLWERKYKIDQANKVRYFLFRFEDFEGKKQWMAVGDIEADNLHAALYAACVYVAKEKA